MTWWMWVGALWGVGSLAAFALIAWGAAGAPEGDEDPGAGEGTC